MVSPPSNVQICSREYLPLRKSGLVRFQVMVALCSDIKHQAVSSTRHKLATAHARSSAVGCIGFPSWFNLFCQYERGCPLWRQEAIDCNYLSERIQALMPVACSSASRDVFRQQPCATGEVEALEYNAEHEITKPTTRLGK